VYPESNNTIKGRFLLDNFTVKMLNSLSNADKGKRDTYHDKKVKGLTLRITEKGVKSFVVRQRVNGKAVMITLGRYPAMTIEQARKSAMDTLNSCSSGINPNDEKHNNKINSVKLESVFNDYLSSRGSNLKEKTISDYKSIFNSIFKDWSKKEILSISRNMVEVKHKNIGKKSIYRANAAMRLLRALFNYASGAYEDSNGEPIVTHNPVQRISHNKSWFKEKVRTNILQPSDLKPWYKAVQKISELKVNSIRINVSDTTADLLVFILFTGLRQSEASGLLWSDVDFSNDMFTVRNTKNHTDHTLPLTNFTKDLLIKRKHLCSGKFVFCGKDKDSAIVNPYKQVKKIREISGIEFTMHDLRRTFGTIADSLEIQHHIIKKLMNHTNNDVTIKHYVQPSIERLRKPIQQISDYIIKQVK